MFQSITSITYSNNTNTITIIDSDFQELLVSNKTYWLEDIIEVYSRRNLNVALNLFLYMQYEYEIDGGDDYSIDNQISIYKEDVKDFEKYIPEINKYLSLL